MDIPPKYDPSKTEERWYEYWMKHGFFSSHPDDREPYTIVIPPPNVTGVLHMGHMLNNTIQDVLIRKNRMEGRNSSSIRVFLAMAYLMIFLICSYTGTGEAKSTFKSINSSFFIVSLC